MEHLGLITARFVFTLPVMFLQYLFFHYYICMVCAYHDHPVVSFIYFSGILKCCFKANNSPTYTSTSFFTSSSCDGFLLA